MPFKVPPFKQRQPKTTNIAPTFPKLPKKTKTHPQAKSSSSGGLWGGELRHLMSTTTVFRSERRAAGAWPPLSAAHAPWTAATCRLRFGDMGSLRPNLWDLHGCAKKKRSPPQKKRAQNKRNAVFFGKKTHPCCNLHQLPGVKWFGLEEGHLLSTTEIQIPTPPIMGYLITGVSSP